MDYPHFTIAQQIEVVNSITSTNSNLSHHIAEKVTLLGNGYFAALFDFFCQATRQRVYLNQPGTYETILSDLLAEFQVVIAARTPEVLPIAEKRYMGPLFAVERGILHVTLDANDQAQYSDGSELE